MVVQHNLVAMNSNRMLGLTSKSISSTTEKLSSGYRINRAADDAAGLAISEKMRQQVRGLTQASTNAEDGISCVQTAEGALSEVQDMLQRMNELSIQAANGTESTSDRTYIQDEIDQLVSEIDRVAETTKFNETFLLKGDQTGKTSAVYMTDYSVTFTKNLSSNATTNASQYKMNYTGTNNVYMVDKSILTSSSNMALSADKVQNGSDITDYFIDQDPSDTHAVSGDFEYGTAFNTDNYVSFVNSELNSNISTSDHPYGLDSNGNMADLYADANNGTLRASQDLYIYNSATDTMTHKYPGDEMTEFLNSDNTLNDQYRLTDILYGDTSANNINLSNYVSYDNLSYNNPIATTAGTAYDVYNGINGAGTSTALRAAHDMCLYNTDTNDYIMLKQGDEISSYLDSFSLTPSGTGYSLKSDYQKIDTDSLATTGTTPTSEKVLSDYFTRTANMPNDYAGVDPNYNASKDLYIYDKTADKLVLARQGEDVSTYVNTDGTLKDGYSLLNMNELNNTSQRVVNELSLNGNYDYTSVLQLDTSKQKLYDADGHEVSGMALNKYFDNNGNYIGGLYRTSQARAIDEVFASEETSGFRSVRDVLGAGATTIGVYISQSSQKIAAALNFSLQVGAQSERTNKITANIDTLTAAGLGIDKLASYNIGIVDETGDNATDAVDVIADALSQVSRQRAALGAVQNRLEHTINNLDNVVENTTQAESQIRDTDMAEEMVSYSNANILQQAGQSMLAQANQSNQGVLSLLQG